MRFRYEFLPQGSVVQPGRDRWTYRDPNFQERIFDPRRTVICDVGNLLQPGVIDQHAVKWQDLCTTALIASEPDKYLANIDRSAPEITLVTHLDPDFDASAALYLARYFLEHDEMPRFSFTLAKYAQRVDSGRFELDPVAPLTPAALIMALSYLMESNTDPMENSQAALLEMFRFFDQWPDLLIKCPDAFREDFLYNLKGFENAFERVKSDVYAYFNDVNERSDFFTLPLKNHVSCEVEEVDCIVTYSPESILWKYWARNDKGRSNPGGFPVTCGFFDTFEPRTRAIIATNPNSPYHLKGLGLLLDKLEIDALRENGVGDPFGDYPRPGFLRQNPWYDGRNALHQFTIIDAPSGGSVLSREAIVDALQSFEIWSPLSSKFETINTLEKLAAISVG